MVNPQLLILPCLAGLALTGIHAYFGIHIVERGVIFASVSLVQLAALGTTVALLVGYGVHSGVSHACSFGFTLAGAAILALTKVKRTRRIPREAVFAIVYIVSAAAAIVLLSLAPQEAEHLKDMMAGNVLAVRGSTILKAAILYSIVGLFHFIFRRKFLAISIAPHDENAETIADRNLWDFLFYASLGLVVASSVAIAGVLLVVSYLIVPPVAAMLFATSVGNRLAIGWSMGAIVSALGVLLSFKIDLPTGTTIVCTFGIALSLMAIARVIFRPKLA